MNQIKIIHLFSLFTLVSTLKLCASNTNLPDKFPLIKLAVVGAHNAGTSYSDGWIYGQQSGNIEAQFNAGARFFKLPLQWYSPSNGAIGTVKSGFNKFSALIKGQQYDKPVPVISICHESPASNNCALSIIQRGGKAPDSALKFLTTLFSLAQKNPKEIIIIKLESHLEETSKTNNTQGYTNAQIIAAMDQLLKESGLSNVAFKLQTGNLPTLGELRSSHKNVIIFINDDILAKNIPYLNYEKESLNQAHWENDHMVNCDLAYGSANKGLFEVNINSEASIKNSSFEGKILGGLNSIGIKTGKITPTDYNALHTPENIQKRIDTCEINNNLRANILSSDHIEVGGLSDFVMKRNNEFAKDYQ